MIKKIYIVEDKINNMKLFLAILNTIPDIEIIAELEGDKGLDGLRFY